MHQGIVSASAMAILASTGTASAEDVTITARFPAPEREATLLRSLHMARFGGREGGRVGYSIERALLRPDATGSPYFDMIGPGHLAEGNVTGSASTDISRREYKEKRKQCVERDRDNKCVREEEREVACTERMISLSVDLRIARSDNGRVVYAAQKPYRENIRRCVGDSGSELSSESVISVLIDRVGEDVRSDLVSEVRSYSVRFRESRSGMSRDVSSRFRNAIRLSQSDLGAACSEWEAIEAASSDHPSVLFNLGLCAEAGGDYQRALDYYARASRLMGSGNMAEAGIARVQQLIEGRRIEEQRAAVN
ncbi:tetratricopeptide repeat protein [Sphingosinithalassobacter portus]|uniref:tetratricopeptide repeat protein n=1 Tax=Stakelama portus TaxID=2676234 RepID=UPI0011AB86BD|nr:tetratricopeptide repeat protein [Sphingosinithalassobacter portus]